MPSRKKTVTLEQVFEKLETISKKQTDHDRQFKKVFEKLTSHDKQFASVAKHLFSLEDLIKQETTRLDKRIKAIEINIEKLTGDLETLMHEYHAITAALKRLETAVDAFAKGQSTVRTEMDSLNRRMSVIEGRVMALESH